MTLRHLVVILIPLAQAQTSIPTPVPSSRAEADRAEQERKAENLKPWEPDAVERAYMRVIRTRVVKGFLNPGSGLSIRFGGLYPGGGFAAGPSYSVKGLLKENLNLTFSAAGSIKAYYGAAVHASLPHLLQDRAVADVVVGMMSAPQVDYYGPGNSAAASGISNYLFENFTVDARFGLQPMRRWLQFGLLTGYSRNNVGPGTSDASPSTDRVYSPVTTPGINRQSPVFYAGPFISWDTRDYPNDPHRGTNLYASYSHHQGLDISEFSFRRLRLGAEQYIPFFNEKRVIAMRAIGVFSYTDPGHAVPLYEQLTIGGPNDVRGLPRFRYYGPNSLVGNFEYRWEIAPVLAMALFADAGRVSQKPGDVALSGLHGSGGFGFRFKSRNEVVMRIDMGFSPQGVQFWWTFNDIFRRFYRHPF